MSERLRNEAFFETAITCAFLIAAADGSQSEVEYDALLDRLELLGGVDRDRIDEMLTTVSNDVEANGFLPRVSRVGELVTDKAAGEAALMLGLAVALADDDFSSEERDVANQLAKSLGLMVDLDELVAELR